MVKSNKFDYTGRTSSGPKLGKSIASDLEKRADKKQREAIKSLSATRLSFKLPASATRIPKKDHSKPKDKNRDDIDKDATIHKLDLKVPSKALTDEGFSLLAHGLQNALNTCQDLALVDLNLTDNELTTCSLARLAPLIHASRHTLQTLDLSNNNFKVSTSIEAQEWLVFLQSFRSCMTLRRLDLSNNPSLGSQAFEVLARVYSREPPVEPLPATGNQSFITLPDGCSTFTASKLDLGSFDSDSFRNGNAPDHTVCANGKTLADPWVLKYRCGLRSIPFLTLTNVGLDDTGALFLSYLLEQHYYPVQLVTENNAAEATNHVRIYRQDTSTKGVDWETDSDSLSKDGLHLLQCAEKLRMKVLLGDSDSITSSYMSIGQSDAYETSSGRSSGGNLRRTSIRSVDYSIYDKSDINSARKKIQRNTIVQAGCQSVDLWRVSLTAIINSRKIFLLAPVFKTAMNNAVQQTGSANSPVGEPRVTGADMLKMNGDALGQSLSDLSLRPESVDFDEIQAKRSYAATLMTTSPADSLEPETAMMGMTGQSAGPRARSSRKFLCFSTASSSHSTGSERNSSDEREQTPHVPTASSEDYSHYQEERLVKLLTNHGGESNGYRDISLRCQLPLPVCLQILQYSMEPRELDILGDDKQRKAFEWGQKRDTLMNGYEWRMKDESSQLLMLLASAECVEY